MKKLIIIGISVLTFISSYINSKTHNLKIPNQVVSELQESIKRGGMVYEDMCNTCHLPNGLGVSKVYPPLANSDYLREKQIESIKAIKYGLSGQITVNGNSYNGTMTTLGLSDQEVADVMNYINNNWGNSIENFVTAKKVSEL
ncbi:c-type cytochrome [Winogradskyella sp. Asnod2-B02-A]|uniref:c-type cytochrome n=1 Tax=Winogradskyella sp. Asnod2-B02-A TaxID=3160583 RepID=UPI00387023D2